MLGLLTAIGVGGLISSVFSGPVGHVRRMGLAMLCSAAIWGAAFAGFALAAQLWLALSLLAVARAAGTSTVVFRSAIVQSVTPGQFRGRVLAADYVVGLTARSATWRPARSGRWPRPRSARSAGLVTVAGSVVIGLLLPVFARYRPRLAAGEQDLADQAALTVIA